MGLPSFIIVGAERCGTTSLYYNLCKHTNILPAYQKEIEFFDRYYDFGQSWYEAQFYCPEGAITGEATPTYFWNPIVPGRIMAMIPDCKIIILLRDVESAMFSKYNQQVSKRVETLTYEEALRYENIRIAGELERVEMLPYTYYPSLFVEYAYRQRYDYNRHLEMWKEFNPLIIEDYFTNTDDSIRRAFEFIGVEYESYEWEVLNKG